MIEHKPSWHPNQIRMVLDRSSIVSAVSLPSRSLIIAMSQTGDVLYQYPVISNWLDIGPVLVEESPGQ